MKTIILTLVLFFLHLTNISAQWEIINEGPGLITSIDFVNDDVGWMAGYNGTLLKTSNGGEDWNSIDIADSINFSQIDFINESVGWATARIAFETTAILKTSDGGLTWAIQQQSNTVWWNSLHTIDEYNVFAVGGNNKIYKTTDGGSNWIDVSPDIINVYSSYSSLWFQNPEIGVVVGSVFIDGIADGVIILRTSDGGNTWNENIVNEFNNISDLQFLENSILHFKANNDSISFLCKTVDMCSSWTILIQSNNDIGGYYYIDTNIVYAAIGDSVTKNNIMKSTDGGLSWIKIQSFNVSYLSLKKIFISNSNYCLIIGWIVEFRNSAGGNVLIKSSNGETFEIKNFSLFGSEWMRPLFTNDINFTDHKRVFIGVSFPSHGSGGDHSIFSTTNGGLSWNLGNRANGYTGSFCFINSSVGFYTTGTYQYKTIDSGITWTQNYEFTNDFSSSDNYFLNSENGWVVGADYDHTNNYWRARILKTTDGGQQWNVEWTQDQSVLKSLYFYSLTGWAVGESGLIVKYTPQTGWVNQTSVTDLPLNKVFFSDDNNGWIAGGYDNQNGFQKILLKTTDCGVNWNVVPNVPYLFRDIVFVDNNLGWAIGYDVNENGGILKTTDGGITWSIDTGNLPAKLNALHIKDNYGWAVGDNGLILRTTEAGAVRVEDENDNSLPTEFVLEQNYPNPFNPSTSILYAISSRQFVTLKVYDLLGREVVTLVNQEQPTGNYEVEFPPASSIQNLVSGVYFYQLKAGSFIQTKKMVIIK
jgi:photosystem II stability/assembly factor-like uncharacterized protein